MMNDLIFVLNRWRIIHLLGISSLRARYARSKLGQMWLTLSNFFMILCFGAVWSVIWRLPIDEYLPYVGVGHILYTTITQTLNDSSGIFVNDARLYLNERLPFFVSVGAHVYKSIVIFAHNIPTIILLVFWSDSANINFDLIYPIVLICVLIFIWFGSYVIAVLCTRFRDLTQIIGLIFNIAFFVTPLMWKIDVIPISYEPYIYLNPFAAMLVALRNPIIGLPVNDLAYYSILIWTVISTVCASILYKKFEKRIIFWV
jgi:lipopolysaccharide transport system permease protein